MTGTHVDPTVTMTALTRTAETAAADVRRVPGSPATHRGVAEEPARQSRHAQRVAAGIALIGIALSLALAWAAARIDHNTEQSLLDGQTRQAAAVLSTAITIIQQPLGGVLDVEKAVRPDDRARAFRGYMADHLGPDLLLQSASLWVRHGATLKQVVSVGSPPANGDTGLESCTFRSAGLACSMSRRAWIERISCGSTSNVIDTELAAPQHGIATGGSK